MIIRIFGHGQVSLPDNNKDKITRIDQSLIAALDRNDSNAYAAALREVHQLISAHGAEIPQDQITASDLVVPAEDTSFSEAKGYSLVSA